MTTAFAIAGAVIQLGGIVLIASPDLVPGARRLGHRMRLIVRDLESRVRGALRLRPRTVYGQATLKGDVGSGGHITSIKGTSATTLEEKVEWLLRRDQEAQRDVTDLATRLAQLQDDMTQLLGALQQELMGHVSDEIAAAQADFRAARITGAFFLTIGLGCATAATLL